MSSSKNSNFINPFSNNNTPNHPPKNISEYTTPYNSVINSNSHGPIIPKEIQNETELFNLFKTHESQISSICQHYVSMQNIFIEANTHLKNEIIKYLSSYKLNTQNMTQSLHNDILTLTRKDNEIKSLKENIEIKDNELKNLYKEVNERKKEFIRVNESLKDEIKKEKMSSSQFKKDLEEKEKEITKFKNELAFLREHTYNQLCISNDSVLIDYTFDSPQNNFNSNQEIYISNLKFDNENLKKQIEKTEKDFNKFIEVLSSTCNKTLDKYKLLYKKINGNDWVNEYSACENFCPYNSYNINEDFSWKYVSDMIDSIEDLIRSMFNLFDEYSKKKYVEALNEESCMFLLKHINTLNKNINIQNELIKIYNLFINSKSFINAKTMVNNLKEYISNSENYLNKYNEILNKEKFFNEFKEFLTDEKKQKSTVEEYLNGIKQNFEQYKIFINNLEKEYVKNKEMIENNDNFKIEIDNEQINNINKNNNLSKKENINCMNQVNKNMKTENKNIKNNNKGKLNKTIKRNSSNSPINRMNFNNRINQMNNSKMK